MKKLISLSLVFALTFAWFPSQKAHGGIALITWATGGAAAASIATVGGAAIGAGVLAHLIGCYVVEGKEECDRQGGFHRWSVAALAIIMSGLILLDENGAETLQYQAIDSSDRNVLDQLGISEHEAQVFNSEVEMVNAVRETIMRELLESGEVSPQAANRLWAEYGQSLAPETMTVVQGIGAQLIIEEARP